MAEVTSTSQVGSAVGVYYDKLLLARAKPEQIHSMFAQQRNIPSKNSDVIKFRRYTNLAVATTALTEGVTPSGHALSVTDMTATVEQYGSYLTITDKVQYIVEDNVMNESVDLLGQQMGETIDTLVRNVLATTASATACSAGVNGGTPTELTYSDILSVITTLKGQNAKMFTPVIQGTNKFGTAPIRASYWGLGSTDLIPDLEAIDEFVNVANYAGVNGQVEGEWGAVGNTRWVLSSLGYSSGGTYSSFILGKDAYAVTMLKEGISETIFMDPIDPLKQRSTAGWKTMFASRILNDNFMVRLTSTLG